MENTEFEEKEYEGPLKNQLLNNQYLEWTPGQVFEKYFGIDAALNVASSPLWDLFGVNNPRLGVKLSDYKFGYIQKKIKNVKNLPDFSLNVFIQVKRPEYLRGIRPNFANRGIPGAYYRFKITPHQQVALEKLHRKLNNKALVIYASPAFYKQQDLYDAIRNKDIVENSTYVKAINLTSHSQWVYDRPGTQGLACSEIKKINDINFTKMLGELHEGKLDEEVKPYEGDRDDRNYNEKEKEVRYNNMLNIFWGINDVFKELEYSNPLVKEYFYRDHIITETVEDKYEQFYMRILSALDILKITWLVL